MIARAAMLSALVLLVAGPRAGGAQEPGSGALPHQDGRLRALTYNAGQVYRLHGYVGYQVDLEFEAGESFVGLGAGDVEGISFASQANHLFLKPRAPRVRTNLTVLTTRRSYHFEYEVASAAGPDPHDPDLVYGLRFLYAPVAPSEDVAAHALEAPAGDAPANRDYWFCGSPTLQPLAAFDDGVHTHLRFNPRNEMPAIFVQNEDGSESLLNFNVQSGEVVIHRVANRFVLRRGKLQGCVVNRSFTGSGHELQSGTVATDVERATRGPVP
jgi:type IV secretion system protein VirB9